MNRISLKRLPLWTAENCRIKARLCRRIESLMKTGITMGRALGKVRPERYRGRPYRSDPRRRIRLSRSTVRRAFVLWEKDRRPEVFIPRYPYGQRGTVAEGQSLQIIRLCLEAGSFREAHLCSQKMGSGGSRKPTSYESFLRRIPGDLRGKIKKFHRLKGKIQRAVGRC